MTTTVLFIEHLITGVQATIWIGLIVLSCFGTDWLRLDGVKDFETVGAFLAVSLVYPLGIFVDNLADTLFKRWNDSIREQIMRAEQLEGGSLMVMEIIKNVDDEYLKAYIGYIRTRIRISRSTTFNFALITLCAVVFTAIRLHNLPKPHFFRLLGFEIVAGTMLTVLALLSWRSITATFCKKVIQTSKMLESRLVNAIKESQAIP
jgi:hypothetical protein